MPTQHIVQFMSEGYQLTGTLHLPDTHKPTVVIGCHGLLADRRSPKQIALADALNCIGIAYFRFDHRGSGDSPGSWDTHALLPSRCRDLYHAIQTMQTHSAIGSLAGLFGSSFGGTVVMAAAAEHPVPRLVTYAAPINSQTVHQAAADQIQTHNALSSNDLATLAFDIRPQLPLLNNILIMHGEKDEIVPPEHARQIFQSAQEPKKIVIHKGGDHRMSSATHQEHFIAECLAWYQRPLARL
jgi:uncharacterized protein